MGIRFTREPYTVSYYKDGEKKTIRRRPPPKLHEALPEDKVTLTRGKNDDWPKGETYKVKTIQNRSPNVLQLVNEEGLSTFIDYYDMKLETTPIDRVREGRMSKEEAKAAGIDLSVDEQYLLWP